MQPEKISFWRNEMKILDKLYDTRIKEWQQTADLYDLKFDKQIRDLKQEDLVKIPRFYPLVRQIIATVAFNYPKVLFKIEDDEGDSGISEIMERAASSLLHLMNVKPHVHQAIFDSLICGVGWLRVDFNPEGDEMIAPYVANDAMHEDLTAISRVAPGFVQPDPTTPPHMFGHARYVRERMWVLHEFLMEEEGLQHKDDIRPTGPDKEMGFGELMFDRDSNSDAARESIKNGGYVLLDRIHDRLEKGLWTFVEGVEGPVLEVDHPFRKLVFPNQMDKLGQPIMDENGEPLVDLEDPSEGTGWLVENGFQFIPVKFDLHPSSFIPKAHLKYIEDMQFGIVESMSRQAALLKRTSRQGVVKREESLANPHLKENLRRGVDGEWHDVEDVNNIRELNYGTVPPDQKTYEDRLLMYEEETTRVTELSKDGPVRSATEAALIGAAVAVNREWMEVGVANVYELCIRNPFQIMGDPRYTPDNFKVNVAPDGHARISRALRTANFLWDFRLKVKAGSMQPLFEQMQQERFLQFYDRAIGSPNFDMLKMDKMMAMAFDTDPDTVMIANINVEAQQAANIENDLMVAFRDPGVLEGQDHKAHIETHDNYQTHPQYQELQQQSQQVDFQGIAINANAQQSIQFIDEMVAAHREQHTALQEQEQTQQLGPQPPAPQAADLQEKVRSNAQETSQVATAESMYQ
jgi:hypothetical protein